MVPRPRQAVLQHGQLVEVITDVVEEALDERRLDRAARFANRSPDRLFALQSRQRRYEKLHVAHGLGEPGELHAIADEVGAHCDHYMRRILATMRLQEQLHEARRFVAPLRTGDFVVVGARVPEEFLKLVDDDQHAAAGQPRQLGERLGQSRARPRQEVSDAVAACGAVRIVFAFFVRHQRSDGIGEMSERIVAGSQHRDAPRLAVVRLEQ